MKFHGIIDYVGPLKQRPSKYADGGNEVYVEVVIKGVGAREDFSILCDCLHEPAQALHKRWEASNGRIPHCAVFDIKLAVLRANGTATEPVLRQRATLTSYAFVQPSDPESYQPKNNQ